MALALAHVAKVTCVVFSSPATIPAGVELRVADASHGDAHTVENIKQALEGKRPDWWIGHDVHTGTIANLCREGNELSCVINHMDYLSYKPLELDTDAIAKSESQATIFRAADLIAAIGPKLARTVRDLVPNTGVFQLIPGCEDYESTPAQQRFSVLLAGRFSDKTDPLKQHRAAVLAFAECAAERTLGADPVLTIAGTEQAQFDELVRIARQRANGACNIVNAGVVASQQAYASILSRQSLVVVPSVYEGFSLVGWEALSAAIPVALSKNTGLAEFLEQQGLDKSAYEFIDIRGHLIPLPSTTTQPNEADIANIRESIIQCFNRMPEMKVAAEKVRSALRSRYEWGHSATRMVTALKDHAEEKYDAVSLGVSDDGVNVSVASLSCKLNIVGMLHRALRKVSASVFVPSEERSAVAAGSLGSVCEGTVTRVLEAWLEYPWDIYVSSSQNSNRSACIDWVLGMTLPVKGKRVFGISSYGIGRAELDEAIVTTLARTRPQTPIPRPLRDTSGQAVADAVASIAGRVNAAIHLPSPPAWLLVLDPRIRMIVDVDTRKMTWRRSPLDFDDTNHKK
jgi:glycosyltransferase involved in cell wall biosynthesis